MALLKNTSFPSTNSAVTIPSGPESARPAARIETFTSGTTTWTAPSWVTEVEVLVVAGGGGGGWDVGGGGGAGGLIYRPAFTVTPGQSYTVTVGTGGAGANASPNRFGSSGNNSVFGTLTAIGGGGGGGWNNIPGLPGGSGGGQTSNRSRIDFSPGIPGQGFPGGRSAGNATPSSNNYAGASGGGGAGGPGGDGVFNSWEPADWSWGNGGHGLGYAISGLMQYYAGGGGAATDSATNWGVGGLGGGGGIEQSGTANTGGGGGGGSLPTNIGGAGGSGVVIVKYYDPRVLMFTDTGTTTWVAPAGVTSLEVLVVGGGGAGGNGTAGGGGAGGVIYYGPESPNAGSSFPVTPGQSYTVTVGAGAARQNSENQAGANGGNSTFASITVTGGGGGGGDGVAPRNGGSGGGSYSSSGGTGIAGQGNAGGRGPAGPPYGSGGGGGAGAAGQSTNISGTQVNASGGAGGDGRLTRITGHYMFVAGGGAGAGYSTSAQGGSEALGGRGGGGKGSMFGISDQTHHYWEGRRYKLDGQDGLGGGGGGGGETAWPPNSSNGRLATNTGLNRPGGAGGSGLVVIKGNAPLITGVDVPTGSLAGYMYYNTNKHVPEVYSRGSFRDASIADLDGTRPEFAAPSARHIKRLLGEAATSGHYWINIRGIPTLTYCEMNIAEGGWMLGMNINTSDGSIVHFSNHQFWESPYELTRFPNNTRPTANPFQCFRRDYKAIAGGNLWANYPGTELMIVVHESNGQNFYGWRSWNLNTAVCTKFSQFWNGTRYYTPANNVQNNVQYYLKITDGSTGWSHSGPAGSLSSRTPNSYEAQDLITNAANGNSDTHRLTQVNTNAGNGTRLQAGYSRGDNSGAGFGTYYDTTAGGRPESDAQNWDSGTWTNSGGGRYGSDTLDNSNFSSWAGKENSGGGGDTYNWNGYTGLDYDFAIYIR
jgi:hypothetical protein